MQNNEIRKLIADFYEGTISTEDEGKLASYFSCTEFDSLPEDLKSTYLLFSGFKSIREENSPVFVQSRKVHKSSIYRYSFACTFACLIIAFALMMFPRINYGYDYDGKTIVSEEKALEEIENLQLLALLKENEDTVFELINY